MPWTVAIAAPVIRLTVSDQQLRDLLAIRMHKRTRVMILLAAFAGLRVHEIAEVRGEDVDPLTRTLRVTGKGNVTATLPLHPLIVEAAWDDAAARRVVPRQRDAASADLRTAQTLLRHANLNTTATYVQVSDPKRVEAIDRLNIEANTHPV